MKKIVCLFLVMVTCVFTIFVIPTMAADVQTFETVGDFGNAIVTNVDAASGLSTAVSLLDAESDVEWDSSFTKYYDQLSDDLQKMYDELATAFYKEYMSEETPSTSHYVYEAEITGKTRYWVPVVILEDAPITPDDSIGDGYNASATAALAEWNTEERRAELEKVMYAFVYDNPQYYWIRTTGVVGFNYICNSKETVARIFALIGYTKYDELMNSADAAVDAMVYLSQLSEAVYSLPDVYKVAYWDNWLCANNTYNKKAGAIKDESVNNTAVDIYGNAIPWSLLSALNPGGSEENDPVCEGYAKAMQLLCLSQDIPCVPVCKTDHMFLAVRLAGHWYLLDTTWNDSDLSESAPSSRKYLLTGWSNETHQINMGFFVTPELSAEDYAFMMSDMPKDDAGSWLYLDLTGGITVSDPLTMIFAEYQEDQCGIALYTEDHQFVAVKPAVEISLGTSFPTMYVEPVFTQEQLEKASYAKRFVVSDTLAPTAEWTLVDKTGPYNQIS